MLIIIIITNSKPNSVNHLNSGRRNGAKWKRDSYPRSHGRTHRECPQISAGGGSRRGQYAAVAVAEPHRTLLTSAQVRARESYRCAVTGAFDLHRARYLLEVGRGGEIPESHIDLNMEAAHIIPFSLNDFNSSITSDVVCNMHLQLFRTLFTFFFFF